MKFLLKIVQGPNAGAEIALVEGVRVTLGSADSCDIVLADPTLPAEACAIETSSDAVVLTPSGAAPEALEPLRVRSFGTTALAIGPADAPWGPLNWEAPAAVEPLAEASDTRSESMLPVAEPTAVPSPEPAPEGTTGGSGGAPRSLSRSIGCLVLLLLLLLLAAWLLTRRWVSPASPPQSEVGSVSEALAPGLANLLSLYGLVAIETNGTTLVRGDFATRAERLAATAALYEAQPGIALDLADHETLLASTTDLLQAATEGALTVSQITNRIAVLAGRAPDPATLKAALEALHVDVPRLHGFDTAAVTLDSPIALTASRSAGGTAPRPSKAAARAARLPLCGILLQPYPCLVLQNGQRLAVGAEVGGYKIETIARDRITLRRGEEEPVEWTP